MENLRFFYFIFLQNVNLKYELLCNAVLSYFLKFDNQVKLIHI